MSRPLVSQVFGKKAPSRQTCGKHEKEGGHELYKGLRVCLYEEYVATIHEQKRSMGAIKRAGLVGGEVERVLPGGFAAEVRWDGGQRQRGTYYQSVLFTGDEVPKAPMDPELAPQREVAPPRDTSWFDLEGLGNLWDSLARGPLDSLARGITGADSAPH